MKKITIDILVVAVILVCAICLFACNNTESGVLSENKIYPVVTKVNSFYLEINAADVTIKQGESFSVVSNLKNLTVQEQGENLIVKDIKNPHLNYNKAILEITVPRDFAFDKVDISTGAGTFNADVITANEVDFEFGAGEVTIDKLVAKVDADIDSGAGEVTVSSGEIKNLDIDMGVGELNLKAEIVGNSEFDLGVGASNITIIGNSNDYFLVVESGIGSITVDGKTASGTIGQEGSANRIDVNGGVGSITINFQLNQ